MKRDKKKLIADPMQEKIAGNIVRKWIWVQEKWAVFMQGLFERFSITGKKVLLICMCVLFGGYSLYLIAESISNRNKKIKIVTSIQRPEHILKSGEPKKLFNPEAEYKKIEQLKLYRDSIHKAKIK